MDDFLANKAWILYILKFRLKLAANLDDSYQYHNKSPGVNDHPMAASVQGDRE